MSKIAIIDIGSNNIKLEIYDVDKNGHASLVCIEKVRARLAEGLFFHHELSEKRKETAIEGLAYFKKIIESYRVETIISVGTAALREAKSVDFLDQIKEKFGFEVKIISGREEAQYVYSGILGNIQFNKRVFFAVDVGGGSTEISICDEKGIHFAESLRVGTIKMKDLFEKKKTTDIELIKKYIKRELKPFLSEIKSHKIDMAIFTGGTARNILEIIRNKNDLNYENDQPIVLTSLLQNLVKEMRDMPPKELKKLKGLDEDRVDIILPGSVIMLTLLKELKIEKMFISNKGLRDGILADYIFKNINKDIYKDIQQKYRYASLEKFAEKYNLQKQHGEHCAFLSSCLFEELKIVHRLNDSYKIILYSAALLHDCGIFIDYSQHHKHTQYLVLNTELLGFSKKEKLLIALTARYHRKGFPKSSHSEFQSLPESKKEVVIKLAALLRVADALDRSYQCAVKDIKLLSSDISEVQLLIRTESDISLELWSLKRKKDYFEKIYKKKLKYKIT